MKRATAKQKKFVDKYLETGNATDAASHAYEVSNRHTAQVIGSENLSKPVIRQLLEQYLPDELILSSLQDDINAKPGQRIRELELAAKIKGLTKNETSINLTWGNILNVINDN